MSWRTLARPVGLAALTALALAAGDARPALGASFAVDATHDAVDAAPGDGVCADAVGACTLRAAVMETNALGGADEITLPSGTYTLSIAGRGEDSSASGDLDISGDLTINGAGEANTTIDGGAIDRVLNVRSGSLSLSALTIRGGDVRPVQSPSSLCVFALHGGGAICNFATLRMVDVVITGNFSSDHAGGILNTSTGRLELTSASFNANRSRAAGGAIFNEGTAAISGVAFLGNVAGTDGGAIVNAEDRANPGASMEVTASVVSGNISGNSGGGISNSSAALTVSDTTVANNAAMFAGGIGSGGGGFGGPAFLAVYRSTVSGNTAQDLGGGIIADNGIIENTTVSGNDAIRAGGVAGGNGSLDLINSTIIRNTSAGLGSGVSTLAPGRTTLVNTVVHANFGAPDCQGPVVSLGHNLDSDGTCGLIADGDMPNTDPKLGPLADNGGPTQTHGLLLGSRAIDAGLGCPPVDQRGQARPVDGDGDGARHCDIGAYELAPTIEVLGDAVATLPAVDFKNGSRKRWMLDVIDDAIAYRDSGNTARAIKELRALEPRLDGCGTVADPNDWVVTCAVQMNIRALLRAVTGVLQG